MSIFKDQFPRIGASGQSTGYTINQSIRFNPGDSPYMHKTYSGAGDRTSWTWSCWFKLGYLNNLTPASNLYYQFFSVDEATNDANRGSFHIINDSGVATATQFQFIGHSTVFLKTNRQFRDPSAWMHLVLVWDSDNGLASDRARLYINGERETSFATQNNPSSGQEIGINLAAQHKIGASKNISSSAIEYYFDGYMADIHFLDGYAYGPEYFGEFKEDTDIWIPKEYTESYGTNGFKIDGRDSGDLGDDESGQGNDFSTSGLASHDQMADTPTNNFVTINFLTGGSYIVATNGNLEATASSNISYHRLLQSTLGITPSDTGKYYFEWQVPGSLSASSVDMIGFCDLNYTETDHDALNSGRGYGIGYKIGTGSVYAGTGWTTNSFTFGGFVASNYYGFAYDASTGKLYIYQNGSALNSGDHVATFDKSSTIAPGASFYNNNNYVYKLFNGAQTSLTNSNFNYAPPTGYVAINTKNLGS